ncbi:MAG: hypothetical protein V5A31_06855 [Haloferacaceae archaeon]|jgi:hypothetical protein
MLRSLVARLRSWGTGDENGSRFRPSRLDASVREAHGGGDAEVERELTDVHEQATALEKRRRDG